MSPLPLPVYDEDDEEIRLLFLELVMFLAMADDSARKYMSVLNDDGTVTKNGEQLTITFGLDLEPLRPLEQIPRASDWKFFDRLDFVDFLSQGNQVPSVRFSLRREIFRLRELLDLLHWQVTRNPRRSSRQHDAFFRAELKHLKFYFVIADELNSAEAGKCADTCMQQGVRQCRVCWENATLQAFLTDPLWQRIRSSARKVAELTGVSGTIPDMDLLALSYQFED